MSLYPCQILFNNETHLENDFTDIQPVCISQEKPEKCLRLEISIKI